LIAQKLLESGAQVDAINQSGQTAIMLAAAKGYRETTKLLHQYSASIDTKDFNERNPLIHAASNGKSLVVQYLLEQGADYQVNALDLQGNGGTALIHAARGGHLDVLRLLLKKSVNLNEAELTKRRTALMEASVRGHRESVLFLLDQGAEMNLKDFKGQTALGLAVSRGHLEISKDLLLRGASIQEKDRNANNLLHHAAGNGDIPMIEMLLGSGISKDAVNRDGHTPLMLALKRDHSETIPLLR
jgi:ankyrin repeat protein